MKGLAIGNGISDYTIDVWPSFVPTTYNFNMITKRVYDRWVEEGCFFSFNNAYPTENTLACNLIFDDILILTQDFNIYDLYRMLYPDSLGTLKDENRMASVEIDGVTKTYKRGYTVQEYTSWFPKVEAFSKVLLGDFVSDYLNRGDVRLAMNIPVEAPGYEACKSQADYHYQSEGSKWMYEVLKGHYRILIYSGDTDGIVPTYGTRSWIQTLNWPVMEAWRPWMTDGQVTGFIEKYEGLDFITVHGAGHMCPQWKRKETTSMISAWLHDEPIDQF